MCWEVNCVSQISCRDEVCSHRVSVDVDVVVVVVVHCDDEVDDEERNERSATIQNVNLGGIDLTPKTPALLTAIDATFFSVSSCNRPIFLGLGLKVFKVCLREIV